MKGNGNFTKVGIKRHFKSISSDYGEYERSVCSLNLRLSRECRNYLFVTRSMHACSQMQIEISLLAGSNVCDRDVQRNTYNTRHTYEQRSRDVKFQVYCDNKLVKSIIVIGCITWSTHHDLCIFCIPLSCQLLRFPSLLSVAKIRSIFQKKKFSIIPGVLVYLDDILICASNMTEFYYNQLNELKIKV